MVSDPAVPSVSLNVAKSVQSNGGHTLTLSGLSLTTLNNVTFTAALSDSTGVLTATGGVTQTRRELEPRMQP